MSDRELLELAAKAVGIKTTPSLSGGIWIPEGSELQREWNPLIDDGDALRLAVKLKLIIQASGFRHGGLGNLIVVYDPSTTIAEPNYAHEEIANEDAYSSTRKAVVKVAAKIGRSIP